MYTAYLILSRYNYQNVEYETVRVYSESNPTIMGKSLEHRILLTADGATYEEATKNLQKKLFG